MSLQSVNICKIPWAGNPSLSVSSVFTVGWVNFFIKQHKWLLESKNGEWTKNRWSSEIQPQGRLWIIKGPTLGCISRGLWSPPVAFPARHRQDCFSSMKSRLIKSNLSNRWDAFGFPPTPIVINLQGLLWKKKKCSSSAPKSWMAAFPLPLWGGNGTGSLAGNQLSSLKDPEVTRENYSLWEMLNAHLNILSPARASFPPPQSHSDSSCLC